MDGEDLQSKLLRGDDGIGGDDEKVNKNPEIQYLFS